MIRVLLVSPYSDSVTGGIVNWTRIICNEAEKSNDEVIMLVNSHKKQYVKAYSFPKMLRLASGLISIVGLRKEINSVKETCDIVHICTSGGYGVLRDYFLMRCVHNKPIVYHLHFGKSNEMLRKRNIFTLLFRKCLSMASCVIALDETTFNSVGQINRNSVILENPINTFERKQIVTNKQNIISFLGWVVREKGVEELVEVWNELGQKYNSWKLNIIGPGDTNYLDMLHKKCLVDNCSFAGEVNHIEAMDLLETSKVFVLPSYTEGFPNVILEAMLTKNAIIATDVGAIKQMLSKDCGLVIEPKNKDQLKSAIDMLLADEKQIKYFSCNAYEKVRDNYDVKVVYKKLSNLWESFCDTKIS